MPHPIPACCLSLHWAWNQEVRSYGDKAYAYLKCPGEIKEWLSVSLSSIIIKKQTTFKPLNKTLYNRKNLKRKKLPPAAAWWQKKPSLLSGQPPVKSVMRHISATDGQKMLLREHGTLAQSSPRLKLVLQCRRTKTMTIKCPLSCESESFHAASHSQ